jgi:myo-inositol-1(or 4)-monophosphatase
MKEWKELSIKIADIARSTGRWIAEEQIGFNSERVEIKDYNSLVSYVDKRAEEQLVEGLSELLPEAGFITEEATVTNERKKLSWVVDPLDGTTNFIHGIPLYAVSIGLLQEDELVCGVVYECGRDELFYAALGSGAFCNGAPVRVSAAHELSQSVFPITISAGWSASTSCLPNSTDLHVDLGVLDRQRPILLGWHAAALMVFLNTG